MRALLITAALVAGLVGTAVPAAATGRGLPPVMAPAARNLFPEGVAWDPTRQSLLVGSLTTPALISAVGRDGVARTVVSDPELPGFVGLEVDARGHRIVAAIGSPFAPGPSFLAVYDLRTGEREQLVDLSGDGHAANDVALDPAGNAYVSDTGAGAVYKVDLAGHVTTLVSDPRLTPSPGANGIVWHPRGHLVVANYTTGKLYRLSGGGLTELRLARPLVGADGMVLRRDGTLVVVTNRLSGLPGAEVAVHELVLAGNAAVRLRTTPWPDPAPTTAAETPYGIYVVDGRLDAFIAGGTANDFVLRRL
ncbi:SMP-30/gluconolactonase/LRE family protein [Actinophytocola algeriensis]|uniref:Sugar lactone lactonase YvrE n=1 Tax=Actinophytocola algeriensis TaxID=1768010 RepID=A0A7W7VDU0_9PSEU|nr:SMP-30/gluconolactonase/LRE family protein [Actinophytocola algeriensis]MBB4906507.1 sugar lactone lactonase YvrE [Actinophytocola algeriensis]MBE1477988.1 sugar lactone lactonase YvrE [Actinophytocola algeriensis]